MGLAEEMNAQGMPPMIARLFGAMFGPSDPEEEANEAMRELEGLITDHRSSLPATESRAEKLRVMSGAWEEAAVKGFTVGTTSLRKIGSTLGAMELRINELEDFISAHGMAIPRTPEPDRDTTEGGNDEDGRYYCPIHKRYES
jgi:hypothetical protein